MNKRRQYPASNSMSPATGPTSPVSPQQPQPKPSPIAPPVDPAPVRCETKSKNTGVTHCHPAFMQTTTKFLPNTPDLATKSGLPFGVVIRPLAPQPVYVANFGASGIPRCRGCRGYLNPFVVFSSAGRNWTCSLCGKLNQTTSAYYAPLDQLGNRTDLDSRPELTQGIVEYDASMEPSTKPCFPPTYFFLIDVSAKSMSSGIVEVIVDVLLKTLDHLLQVSGQTQIGIITFDTAVHFYNLSSGLSRPTMMVMPNLKNVDPPKGYQTVFSLHHSKTQLERLLNSIPEMFSGTQCGQVCLGSAIDAAVESIKGMGGKILALTTSPPTLGGGVVPSSFDPNILGSDKENTLLVPQTDTYKTFAIKCSKLNISVDYFFFGQDANIAELGPLATLTGGQIYHYPSFGHKDVFKFGNDLRDNLVRETAWEAVLRLRCSNGIKPHQYFGHHLLKGVDLLGIPTIDPEKAIAVELHVTESLSSGASVVRGGGVVLQASLLFTNSQRQKRIRVATISCPLTNNLTELYEYCNVGALFNVYSKMLAHQCLLSSFRQQREELIKKIAIMSTTFGKLGRYNPRGDASSHVNFPDSLAMFPLYALSLIKTVVMSTTKIHPDTRCASIAALNILPVEDLVLYLYPRLFQLSSMDPQCGTVDTDNGFVVMPATLNLSSGSLTFTDGIFLLDNGIYLMLWVSRNGGPSIQELFGPEPINWEEAAAHLEVRDPGQSADSFKNRVINIIEALRSSQVHYQPLLLINDGALGSEKFLNCLIEDKAKELPSYYEFVQTIHSAIHKIQTGK